MPPTFSVGINFAKPSQREKKTSKETIMQPEDQQRDVEKGSRDLDRRLAREAGLFALVLFVMMVALLVLR